MGQGITTGAEQGATSEVTHKTHIKFKNNKGRKDCIIQKMMTILRERNAILLVRTGKKN